MVAVDEGSGVDQGRRWSIVVRPAMVVQRLGVHASPASPGPAGQHSLGRGIPAAPRNTFILSQCDPPTRRLTDPSVFLDFWRLVRSA